MTQECRDADITVNPVGKTLKILLDGVQIGQSENALALKEGSYPVRYYFPRGDIDVAALSPSTHSSHCPYKGDASYLHLTGEKGLAENAVWYYAQPCPLVEDVRDHLSFWGDRVEIA